MVFCSWPGWGLPSRVHESEQAAFDSFYYSLGPLRMDSDTIWPFSSAGSIPTFYGELSEWLERQCLCTLPGWYYYIQCHIWGTHWTYTPIDGLWRCIFLLIFSWRISFGDTWQNNEVIPFRYAVGIGWRATTTCVISELTQQDGWRKRTMNYRCVTNMISQYLHIFRRFATKIGVLLSVTTRRPQAVGMLQSRVVNT